MRPLRSGPITGPSSLLRTASAPVPRLGTRGLAGAARSAFSLRIAATGSPVPHESLDQAHAAFMPDAGWAVLGPPPNLIPEEGDAPGSDVGSGFSTRHQRFAYARLLDPYLTGSRPAFSLNAHDPGSLPAPLEGGLRSAPESRHRRAYLHLPCSKADLSISRRDTLPLIPPHSLIPLPALRWTLRARAARAF